MEYDVPEKLRWYMVFFVLFKLKTTQFLFPFLSHSSIDIIEIIILKKQYSALPKT